MTPFVVIAPMDSMVKHLRILHIIPYFQPRLGYQETYLARAQMVAGHTVAVLTSDRYAPILYKGGASAGILGDRIKSAGDFIEEGIHVRRLSIAFELLSNVWLMDLEKAIEGFAPDAIHVHSVSPFTTIRIARMKRRLPRTRVVLDNHMAGNALRGKWIVPFYSAFKILFHRTILGSADAFVAISEDTKAFMNIMYGIPLDRIEVIPLGCDTKRFVRNELARKELREAHGIRETDIVFFYAGKITKDKGVDILVDAGSELMKKGARIFVVCLGGKDKTFFESISERIKSSGQTNRFIFMPPVTNEELPKFYSMADVGVWPKQSSLAMLEAMSTGMPIVISDDSGVLERIDSGKCGASYRAGDYRDLSREMEALLDSGARSAMGRKAREVAEDRDWSVVSKSFELVYQRKGAHIIDR